MPMEPESECVEEAFLDFPAGTHREDIWYWFDEQHSKGVGWLMCERKKEEYSMRVTGIVRRMDELHRIVIPKEVCRQMGLVEGMPLEIFLEDDSVVLKKYVASDDVKGHVENLINVIKENDGMSEVTKEAACGALATVLKICAIEGSK